MLKTLGVVQARSDRGRFSSKAMRRLGGKSLLEWVVRRTTDCQRLDQVVVVLGNTPDDERLAELIPSDVPVIRTGNADPLASVAAAFGQYPAEGAVLVRSDMPFVDPVLIDRLVNTAEDHPECDYIGYCSSEGRPTILTAVGMFAEWCCADALLQANRDATESFDRQSVTHYLYSHPESFRVRLIPAPAGLDRDDVRLTVDLEEDWDHAQTIFDALGPEALDWQRIAGLLSQQPAIRKRMAVLNHRQGHEV